MIRWNPQAERSLLDGVRRRAAERLAGAAREITGAQAVALRSDGRRVLVDDPDLILREYGAPGINPEPWAMEAIQRGGRDE